MNWSKQKNDDEIIKFLNESPNMIKVLAVENMKHDDEKARCEGVFVYRVDGDNESGIGFLISNVVTINFPVNRGDIVQYRTIDQEEKPYITLGISGKNN
jgi:hypothetical protein